jgi:hypothetical protein
LGRWVALPASSWHGRLSLDICQNMFQRFDNDFYSLKPYSHAHFRGA